jgi:hypothetical protein
LDEIKSVWDFPGVEKLGSSGGMMSWKCCWCHSTFKGWNATKVLIHVSKFSKTGGQSDIKVCTGRIPKEILELFQTYRNRASGVSSVKRQHSEALSDSIANDQTSMAVAFDIKCQRASHTGGGTATNPFDVFGDSKGGVESSNATRLTSAIAEFVYCKSLSFSSVEGDHFYQILKLARLVSPSYRPPGRKLLSNNLLDLSHEN